MKCPHCEAEHDLEKEGRFCSSCGMSVQTYAKAEASEENEVKMITCRFCGMPSPPPSCKACGHKLPVPDEEE